MTNPPKDPWSYIDKNSTIYVTPDGKASRGPTPPPPPSYHYEPPESEGCSKGSCLATAIVAAIIVIVVVIVSLVQDSSNSEDYVVTNNPIEAYFANLQPLTNGQRRVIYLPPQETEEERRQKRAEESWRDLMGRQGDRKYEYLRPIERGRTYKAPGRAVRPVRIGR